MNYYSIYALPTIDIFAIMIALSACWAVASIIAERFANKTVLYILRAINGILALVFLAVILRYTVFGRTSAYKNAIGFIRTLEQIKAKPELLKEMVMNAFLFFPFGLTFPYALASRRVNKPFSPAMITVLISLCLTCLIELIQGLFGIGNAELSDIIMNVVGSAIGTSSFCVRNKLLKQKNNCRKNKRSNEKHSEK